MACSNCRTSLATPEEHSSLWGWAALGEQGELKTPMWRIHWPSAHSAVAHLCRTPAAAGAGAGCRSPARMDRQPQSQHGLLARTSVRNSGMGLEKGPQGRGDFLGQMSLFWVLGTSTAWHGHGIEADMDQRLAQEGENKTTPTPKGLWPI